LKTKVAMRLLPRLLRWWRRELIVPAVSESRALVTGGTGRVGRAIVARLEAEGFRVLAAGQADGDVSLPAEARQLVESALGLVVMIEDVAAYQAWPSFAPHCAAKAAQAMLTRVLARALAPDVRVCGIAPGPVAVDPEEEERRAAETLLGRVGSPDDVAAAVVYLAGAGFVTGTTLVVDGGRLLT
jgi:NAD(P)-dependent dehydrogenase (short-subunit alcohol dehydrogenase family)